MDWLDALQRRARLRQPENQPPVQHFVPVETAMQLHSTSPASFEPLDAVETIDLLESGRRRLRRTHTRLLQSASGRLLTLFAMFILFLSLSGAIAWWLHSPSASSLGDGGSSRLWWQRLFAEHTFSVESTTVVAAHVPNHADLADVVDQARLVVTKNRDVVADLVAEALSNSSIVCENTKQGRLLVTDELGFVCSTTQLNPSRPGCCLPPDRTAFERFSCETCDSRAGCCATFEFCVSCCLGPQNRAPVDALRKAAKDTRAQLLVCGALCRTSSQSITGQRQYRTDNKHCFTMAQRSGFIRVVGNEAVDRN